MIAPRRIQHVPRARDEVILEWLSRHCAGETPAQIAQKCHATPSNIKRAIDAVICDDVGYSCEPKRAVLAGYKPKKGLK